MRQRTVLFVSLVAGTVLFNACSDTTQPTPASDDKVGFDPLQQPDDPIALVRNIPGFGGFFFDREGVPTVYLRDVSARAQVERALGPSRCGLTPLSYPPRLKLDGKPIAGLPARAPSLGVDAL
jgi:hypothetical protein